MYYVSPLCLCCRFLDYSVDDLEVDPVVDLSVDDVEVDSVVDERFSSVGVSSAELSSATVTQSHEEEEVSPPLFFVS